MCGISGYVGGRSGSVRLVLDCLKKLEYRGYDSAGVAVVEPNSTKVTVLKKQGKLENLEASLNGLGSASGTVIAHTRWATHGRPNDTNAHPHCDCSGQIALIHNGIIENYLPLRERLIAEGHKFTSETDTEVVVHLIEAHAKIAGNTMEDAIRNALKEVKGAYAICVISEQEPNTIYAAKTSSPLIIGLGKGENFLASDIPAVMEYTRNVFVMEDGEFAKITPDAVILTKLDGTPISREVFHVSWDVQEAKKGHFAHFMIKEIHDQPQAIRDTLLGRISEKNTVTFPELTNFINRISDFNRIVIVACGTAYHAGMVGKGFFEHLLRRPVEVCVASEFRYSDPIIDQHTLAIIISQSGETKDTHNALLEAKVRGAATLAIVNVVGSVIAREADAVVYTYAGQEISVASTKAYVTQVVALYLIGLFLAQSENKIGPGVVADYVEYLRALPNKVTEILADTSAVEELGRTLAHSSSFFFLGRGFDYAVCLEAALKLKEVTYIHAEAYPAGEMKHGPLALIEPNVSVVCLATQSALYDKMLSNVKEAKAREGTAVAIVKEGDEGLDARSVDSVIRIPSTHDAFMPVLAIIPLQILAYTIGAHLGHDVDQPRNLAKTVTVE